MNPYQVEREKYQQLLDKTSRQYNWLSAVRLILVILVAVLAYLYQTNKVEGALWGILTCVVLFAILLQRHQKMRHQKQFYKQLVQINEHELNALNGDHHAFDGGAAYIDPAHSYTFDLDVFGENSLFQTLNRTANALGSDCLAACFQKQMDTEQILATQVAVQDLAPRLVWRQQYMATGQLNADPKAQYLHLFRWAETPVKQRPRVLQFLYWGLTIATLGSLAVFLGFQGAEWWKVFSGLAFLNLLVVGAHSGVIKEELSRLNALYKIVEQYGALIQCIENENFTAPRIQALKAQLHNEKIPASKAIQQLANLLHQLESIQNIFGALIFNSLCLYHLHILMGLEKWQSRYAQQIKDWIRTTGELEALSSLAHFAFNNPDFVYPKIAESPIFDMQGLGHPLIPAEKRVLNDLAFQQPGFVVLTGSNMSGKSTFLRTVGINLLLAQTGVPVCAGKCTTYPFSIFVCMKLSDSLHHNESYFYAELKRIQRIIQQLEDGQKGFVLLDEVLRGTNSNDKLQGTLGLVETMVRLQATGILATHDLAVCALTQTYPEALRNMCFEVEMTADQLVFDYRLRDGVCVNKSATFLMKKMGIIQGS